MTEIEDNFRKMREATQEFPKLTIFLSRRMAMYDHIPGEVSSTWSVSVVGDKDWCEWAEGVDFDKALAQLVSKLRAAPPRCAVCGGSMDGPCKHSHPLDPAEPAEERDG